MTEIQSIVQLLLGLTAIVLASGLIVACLRRASLVDYVLGTYVVAWALVVALCLLLSPTHSLTTETTLLGSIGALAAAGLVWFLRGRPAPPAARPAVVSLRTATTDRVVAVLAIVVAAGFCYSIALAFLTPINDGDALAYHLARAAFWYQEAGVGYVDSAIDSRLNGNPPNAELGMLLTMLLAGSDRYVAIPQLAAYAALIVCVVGLGRRLGFSIRQAVFGALLFASLPAVMLQASTALNDLVVAAFLAIAAYFALRPGRAALALLALSLGLAVGTKLTALISVPLLTAVVLVGRPRREWPAAAVATAAGITLGCSWYVINLVESGEVDGGLVDDSGQRAEASPAAYVVTLMRLLLDTVDLSGTPGLYGAAYVVVGGAIVLVALALRSDARMRASLVLAGLLVAAPLLVYPVFDVVQDLVFRSWAALGRPPTPPFEFGWNLNVVADPTLSWFGPLGVLLYGGAVAAIVAWRRKVVPALVVLFALAPLALLATFAATITWDRHRGRLILFAVVLAASTWGLLLRSRALSVALVAVASIVTVASMLNYQGKPSGIGVLLGISNPFHVSVRSVWTASRAEVQVRPRAETTERDLLPFVERSIPVDATVAIAPRTNEFLSPYFGSRLTRKVVLVLPGENAPASADWLVTSPSTEVSRCPSSWRTELELEDGWRIERRVAPDRCP